MSRRSIALVLAATAVALTTAAPAFAQSLFDYQVKNKVQAEDGTPVLILRSNDHITKGSVTMERSDGKTRKVKLGAMRPAQEKRIAFEQPKGSFTYRVTIEGETRHGQTMNSSFETEVAYVDAIALSVDREKVQVGEGRLVLNSNRPLEKVDIEVYDADGAKIAERSQSLGGKYGDLEITWPSKSAEVGAIRLTAHDVDGFWNAVVLEPFWVEIPHEEVIFDFGKASWQDTETPKLETTLTGVREAMQKYSKHGLDMQLYIAGYTDTVGSPAENRKLSQQRARAIAKWFKSKGLKIDVWYQGFGEDVLAKQTPDNTPEPLNRRALYILGNAPPPTSPVIPRDAWQKL